MPHDLMSVATPAVPVANVGTTAGSRRFIAQLENCVDQPVTIHGRVAAVRHAKNIWFVEVRDRTGRVQVVSREPIDGVTSGSAVTVVGTVVRGRRDPSAVELTAGGVTVRSKAAPLPSAGGAESDGRVLRQHIDPFDEWRLAMFEVETTVEAAFREFLLADGFIEIHTPKITPAGSESGAAVFTVPYFDRTACLAQSPQFYMQLSMAAGFDRTFEVGPVFRAEPAVTNRHATEFTCLDVELSWVESHEDLMALEERLLHHALSTVRARHGSLVRARFGVDVDVPVLPIPRVSYEEALAITGEASCGAGRLSHMAEQLLTTVMQRRYGHGFVFVTDFPAAERPFYTMRTVAGSDTTRSFDLLWRGIEVTSGCQREHRVDNLQQQMQSIVAGEALSSTYLSDCYLEMFKYGCPPHGGFGIGVNRFLMALLGRPSIGDASFVFRGPTRAIP